MAENQQILIAGYNQISIAAERCRQNLIVVGISTHGGRKSCRHDTLDQSDVAIKKARRLHAPLHDGSLKPGTAQHSLELGKQRNTADQLNISSQCRIEESTRNALPDQPRKVGVGIKNQSQDAGPVDRP